MGGEFFEANNDTRLCIKRPALVYHKSVRYRRKVSIRLYGIVNLVRVKIKTDTLLERMAGRKKADWSVFENDV